MRTSARQMALAGMLTALAVVIMSMGSLIPVNTYVCPVLCILITRVVISGCGKRMALCYYLAVAILALLLAPDREAAMVYVFLGYYPLVRPGFQKIRPAVLRAGAKIALFTAAGAAAYGVLMFVLGSGELAAEFAEMGTVFVAVLILLWDLLFVLVDRLLGLPLNRRKK